MDPKREQKYQKKKQFENATRTYLEFLNDSTAFNLGIKFNMIDQLSDELAQYLNMVDCRRVLTEMLEFVYDPSIRPDDPVEYFAKLTKDRRKDKRELNKARRRLYQLMWKETDIKEENSKLQTLINWLDPEQAKTDPKQKFRMESLMPLDQDLSFELLQTESFRSLMKHRDGKIDKVFGAYSTAAPEPVAVSGKDIIAEKAAAADKRPKHKPNKKKKSSKGRTSETGSAKKKSRTSSVKRKSTAGKSDVTLPPKVSQ